MSNTASSMDRLVVSIIGMAAAIFMMLPGESRGEDNQSRDNPFMVDIDYTDTVSFGGKRIFRLINNGAPDIDYRCKVWPTTSPNIATVKSDNKCQMIIVTASDGPFVDGAGKVLEGGSLHHYIAADGYGRAADLVSLTVEDVSGKELFKTSFSLRVMNGSGGFLLRGMERPRNSEPDGYGERKFVVEPGKNYNFEILTSDGMPLSPAFACSRSASYSDHNDVRISVTSGCKITLSDAQPGPLRVDIEKSSAPTYKETLMFELVPEDWKPPVLEGLTFQLTPAQKQQEYKKSLERVRKLITLRAIDKARGEAYAQDDWYLNYLEQIRGELISRIGGSENK